MACDYCGNEETIGVIGFRTGKRITPHLVMKTCLECHKDMAEYALKERQGVQLALAQKAVSDGGSDSHVGDVGVAETPDGDIIDVVAEVVPSVQETVAEGGTVATG